MGMTITEKILCQHTDLKEVHPGMLINAKVDIALGNDITAPIAIKEFRKAGGVRVFDRDKVVLVPDHFTPNKDIDSAQQCKFIRKFAQEQEITHYYEVGEAGIEHALLPEQGVVLPGDLVIGADSHTCTYGALGAFATGVGSTDLAAAMLTGEVWFRVPETMKIVFHGKLKKWVSGKDLILHIIGLIGVDGARYMAMEFTGETVSLLGMADRLTIANMVIEAGAKNGIIGFDATTKKYLDKHLKYKKTYKVFESDADTEYSSVEEFDCAKLEPMVAMPHLPSNAKPISECKGMPMDQAYIGSCTNGRIEDLRIAAKIMRGKEVKIRTIVVPATPVIWKQAEDEGLFDIFYNAGCVISAPTCGACLGGFMGILAAGEKCISTTNRNFVGRMGSPKSEVYLASPATAAASALTGKLEDPRKFIK